MTISNVALTNTFDEWRVTTNQVIVAINTITEGNSNVNFLTANAVVVGGVNVGTTLVAAFAKANTANVTADLAYAKANTANVTADLAFGHANAAYAKANTANTTADLAFGHANAAYAKANTANTTADLSFNHANAAYAKANTANITADLAFGQANTARDHANAAFASSNTKTSNTNNNTFVGAQRGSATTLTASSNVFTPNFSSNNFFTLTLANNETLANATNTVINQSGAIYVIQSSAGSKTLSFGLAYKFAGNTPPTISTTANAVDLIVYTVRTANSVICDIVQDVGNANDT
jgi:hypothetical protein